MSTGSLGCDAVIAEAGESIDVHRYKYMATYLFLNFC
jgi:hypothetical protein